VYHHHLPAVSAAESSESGQCPYLRVRILCVDPSFVSEVADLSTCPGIHFPQSKGKLGPTRELTRGLLPASPSDAVAGCPHFPQT
jgi:hypothetical protein